MHTDAEEATRAVESVIRNMGLDPKAAAIPGSADTKAYALKRGSARVVIAIHATEKGGSFRVLSPCVRVAETTPSELFKHLLELNAREVAGAAFGVFGDEVVVVAERSLRDLDASEIEETIRDVGRIGDHYDDLLAARFGVARCSD